MQASGGPRPTPGTLNRIFLEGCERFDLTNAFQRKVNGRYKSVSHRTLLERTRHVALGLRSLGINPGDRVAILSENRLEWAITDYACLTAGIVDVPIYATLPTEQIPYLLSDSESVAVVVSDAAQAAKVADCRGKVPSLRHIISFTGEPISGVDMTFEELEHRGRAEDGPEAAARWRAEALDAQPDDLATIIYTSGTTGTPKGVMLTHDNFHSNVAAASNAVPF